MPNTIVNNAVDSASPFWLTACPACILCEAVKSKCVKKVGDDDGRFPRTETTSAFFGHIFFWAQGGEHSPSHMIKVQGGYEGLSLMKNPGAHSVALALCLCLLYSGYETARASSISLLSSSVVGLNGAYVAALTFVLSLLSLQLYGRGTEVIGARRTLLLSAGGCCAVFVGLALASVESQVSLQVVAILSAVRETYVASIATQIWSMLSSSLKERGPTESRRWFCIIQVCGSPCVLLWNQRSWLRVPLLTEGRKGKSMMGILLYMCRYFGCHKNTRIMLPSNVVRTFAAS